MLWLLAVDLNKLSSLILEQRNAVQLLLDMEPVTPAAHSLAAITEVLEEMFHVEPTLLQHLANMSGSRSSTTPETTLRTLSLTSEDWSPHEDEYYLREHGHLPRPPQMAREDEDRARLRRQNEVLQFTLRRRAYRPQRASRRRYSKGKRQ